MTSPALLTSYFYDLSKICFTSLVIGGIIQSTVTGFNFLLMTFGLAATAIFFIVAKSTEQTQKGVRYDTKAFGRHR